MQFFSIVSARDQLTAAINNKCIVATVTCPSKSFTRFIQAKREWNFFTKFRFYIPVHRTLLLRSYHRHLDAWYQDDIEIIKNS